MQVSDGTLTGSDQRSPDATGQLAASDLRLQRILKVLVVVLAILMFAGLAAVIWRVIYLASPSATQPAPPMPAVRPTQSLELPAGAHVRSISLSGSRLAVHYTAGGAEGIAVFDMQTGRMVTDIAVEPKSVGGAPGR